MRIDEILSYLNAAERSTTSADLITLAQGESGAGQVTGITADSRAAAPGCIFAALPGTKADGRQFMQAAIAAGACAILAPPDTTLPPGQNVPLLFSPVPRRALARIAALLAPPAPATILAVTGTNGKTSTVDFCRQIWELQGLAAASIGTLGLIGPGRGGGGGLTTPDPVQLSQDLAMLAAEGVQHVAMEASSHGIEQQRLDGVTLSAAAFSNFTRDHLDYHGTMQAYRAAKLRLFDTLLPPSAIAVMNADMEQDTAAALRAIAQARQLRLITTGQAGADWTLLGTTPLPHGQRLQLRVHGVAVEIPLALPGRFQADNVLLAAALTDSLGCAQVQGCLPRLRGVRGRMELAATLANGAAAYVDYAHTPDALERLLLALRPHTQGRLICVFGAGGDRDPGKRPLMGEVVSRLADLGIITDDNPRSEAPDAIRAAIRAAAPDALDIGNRRQAIAAGLEQLRPGDVLVVAGKGHEQGQIVGRDVLPFDDAGVIRELAGARASAGAGPG